MSKTPRNKNIFVSWVKHTDPGDLPPPPSYLLIDPNYRPNLTNTSLYNLKLCEYL